MNSPDCQELRNDCRLINEGGSMTLMHSPIVYNREGEPVGGGRNIITQTIRCQTCKKLWTSRNTELEMVKGELKWEEINQ